MNRQPSIVAQAEFYDAWNLECRKCDFDEVSDEIRLRGQKVLDLLSQMPQSDLRILEVGCGTGWLTQKLVDFGQVTAIDLSPAAIEFARERNKKAEFIAGDFFAYEFDDGKYDVVVCVETLFYVEDQDRFMQRMADLTIDGGILAVTNINKFVYERSSDIGPPEPGQIRHWLSRGDALALIGKHFKVESSMTIEPRGDMGIMRIVNSSKLNSLLSLVLSAESIKSLKESLGFGGGVVIVARK